MKSIIFVVFLAGVLSFSFLQTVSAALLDGKLDSVEKSLAESVAKKGERLTTGNFYTDDTPSAHAPSGMMGDHTHEKGEYMFSYRLMHMFMQDTRDGTDRRTHVEARARADHMMSPESMRMVMHMFGFMYGLNDTVTLTTMVPYILNNMNIQHKNGKKSTTRAEGVGDLKVGSLVRLWAVEAPSIGTHRFHGNFSISLPTGNISASDDTLSGPNRRLAYPMQIGSGTFDLSPGLTYGGEAGRASWGVQAIGTVRLGKNRNGWANGDAYDVNAYGAYEFWERRASGSVRLNWKYWAPLRGRDDQISLTMSQTGDPARLGGQRLDILGGINFLLPSFRDMELRANFEGGVPVYQYLDGQLETDSVVNFSFQALF